VQRAQSQSKFVRYFLKPVFGYEPLETGEWVHVDNSEERWVECRVGIGLTLHNGEHGWVILCFVYDADELPLTHASPPAFCSFVAKYGPLFEGGKGPRFIYRHGTFTMDPSTGKVDRGVVVQTGERTRWERAREIGQVGGAQTPARRLQPAKSPFHGAALLFPLIPLMHGTLTWLPCNRCWQ
jgi:hypothetical protein